MSGYGLYLRNTVTDSLRANALVQSTTARALWWRAWLERRNPTRSMRPPSRRQFLPIIRNAQS